MKSETTSESMTEVCSVVFRCLGLFSDRINLRADLQNPGGRCSQFVHSVILKRDEEFRHLFGKLRPVKLSKLSPT